MSEIPFWTTLQKKVWFFTLNLEFELMVHDYSNIVAQVCEKLIHILSGN